MKPLFLEFCGLNSYAEPARVDFEALCSRGLFGIFGPTGSGKSTVLDAVTIALYGRAPRVSGRDLSDLIYCRSENTGKLAVSFTFSAHFQGRERRYRIDRLYSLSGPSKCRMVELRPEGDVVLAEKKGELDARVSELIGLSFEDFSRSVVLPQGDFAGFLKLGGKDRTEMIERLFSLEEYGNLLNERIAQKIKTQSAQADSTAQLIREQGEISDQKISELSARAEKLAGDCALQENTMRLAQTLYQMKQRIRQDCAALEEAEVRVASLSAQEPAMAENRRRLEDARRAALCEPLLRAAREAQTSHQKAQAAYSEASRALCEAQERRSHTASALDEQEASLTARQKQAQERRAVLASLESSAREFDSRRQQYGELESSFKALRAEKLRTEQESRNADAAVRAARTGLETLTSRPAEEVSRQQYRQALEGVSLEKQLAQSGARLAELEPRLCAARAEDAAAQDALSKAQSTLSASEEAIAKTRAAYGAFCAKREEHRARNAAALLAANLADGQPCPVCGSVHHPHYAEPLEPLGSDQEQGLLATLEAAEKEAAGRRAALEKAQQAAAAAHLQAETLEAQTEPLRRDHSGQQAALSALQEAAGLSDFAAAAARMERALEETARRAKALEEARRQLTEQERRFSQAADSHRQAAAQAEQAEQKLLTLKNDLFERKETFDRYLLPVRPDLTASDSLTAQMLSAEQTEKEVLSQLEQLAAARTAAGTEQQQAQDAFSRAEGSLQQAKAAWESAGASLSAGLSAHGFSDAASLENALLSAAARAELETVLMRYDKALDTAKAETARLTAALGSQRVSEQQLCDAKEAAENAQRQHGLLREQLGKTQEQLQQARRTLARLKELQQQHKKELHQLDLLKEIGGLLRGRALVAFIAAEYMHRIAQDASVRLERLTHGRYALELGEENTFLVRDNGNGGILRPTATLSGGETFLVSLSLALSLSLQIGLKGQPMGLFFLDEGFGTLDNALLTVVLDALETLRNDGLTVGVISHIPQLRERIGARLLVEKDGLSSRLRIELD